MEYLSEIPTKHEASYELIWNILVAELLGKEKSEFFPQALSVVKYRLFSWKVFRNDLAIVRKWNMYYIIDPEEYWLQPWYFDNASLVLKNSWIFCFKETDTKLFHRGSGIVLQEKNDVLRDSTEVYNDRIRTQLAYQFWEFVIWVQWML